MRVLLYQNVIFTFNLKFTIFGTNCKSAQSPHNPWSNEYILYICTAWVNMLSMLFSFCCCCVFSSCDYYWILYGNMHNLYETITTFDEVILRWINNKIAITAWQWFFLCVCVFLLFFSIGLWYLIVNKMHCWQIDS